MVGKYSVYIEVNQLQTLFMYQIPKNAFMQFCSQQNKIYYKMGNLTFSIETIMQA